MEMKMSQELELQLKRVRDPELAELDPENNVRVVVGCEDACKYTICGWIIFTFMWSCIIWGLACSNRSAVCHMSCTYPNGPFRPLCHTECGQCAFPQEANGAYWGLMACCIFSYLFDCWVAMIVWVDKISIVENYKTWDEILNQFKTSPVHISWDVECYHMTTVTNRVWVKDGDYGYWVNHSHQERSVTNNATETFEYKTCVDLSEHFNDMESLKEHKITFLRVFQGVDFQNDETQTSYYEKMEAFRNAHVNYDKECFLKDTRRVEGCEKYYIVTDEKKENYNWMALEYYVLFSLLLVSPIYRMFLASAIGKKEFIIVKRISSV